MRFVVIFVFLRTEGGKEEEEEGSMKLGLKELEKIKGYVYKLWVSVRSFGFWCLFGMFLGFVWCEGIERKGVLRSFSWRSGFWVVESYR